MFFEGSEFFEKKQKKFLRNFGNGLKWQAAKTLCSFSLPL